MTEPGNHDPADAEMAVARGIRLPTLLGSRGRDRELADRAELERSERDAARLGRLLDPDASRHPTPRPDELGDDADGREKRAGR